MVDRLERDSDAIRKISGPTFVSEVTPKEEERVDSGVSSIKKSEAVVTAFIPSMGTPLLPPPSIEGNSFTITSKDATGIPCVIALNTGLNSFAKIKEGILESWSNNLREIDEMIRQLLRSPNYQQLMAIRHKGDPIQSTVSGIQPTTAASKTRVGGVERSDSLAPLDRLRVLERVSPSAEIQSSTPPTQPAQAASILPLAASVLIGGGLALGVAESTVTPTGISSNILIDAVDLVQQLQPLFTHLTPEAVVPFLNLLAVPLYMNAWRSTFGEDKKGLDTKKHIEGGIAFAKDIKRMTSDPDLIMKQIYRMPNAENLSLDQKENLARMIKFALLSIALGFLYAVEVGKVQGAVYQGNTFEEMRDLLFGNLIGRKEGDQEVDKNKPALSSNAPPPWQSKPLPPLQNEMVTLAAFASQHLSALSPEDKVKAADIALDYTSQRKDVEHLLDPSQVFSDLYEAFTFKPRDPKA